MVVVAVVGCGKSERNAPTPAEDREVMQIRAGDSVPDLVEVTLNMEEEPWGPVSLALSPDGTLAELFSQGGSPYLTLIGADGAVKARVGRRGEGPGELSGSGEVWYDGTGFAVLDGRRGAVIRFADSDGGYIGEQRYLSNAFPLALNGDSLDRFFPDYILRGEKPSVERVSLSDGGVREILGESDPVFSGSLRFPASPGNRFRAPPPYFHDQRATIWADPWSYSVRAVLAGGSDTISIDRDLPPNHRGPLSRTLLRAALERSTTKPMVTPGGRRVEIRADRERLDTLDREVLPLIMTGGLGLDGLGRLLVVGVSDDSVFVDFFHNNEFVVRRMLDCFTPGTVAIGRDRLALLCRTRTTERGYNLREWLIR